MTKSDYKRLSALVCVLIQKLPLIRAAASGQKLAGEDADGNQISEPFIQNGYAWATDGRIAIRAAIPLGYTDENPSLPRPEMGKVCTPEIMNAPWTSEMIKPPVMDHKAKMIICKQCNGVGKFKECPECDGAQEVEIENDFSVYSCECKTCDGDGCVIDSKGDEDCNECDGVGRKLEVEVVEFCGYEMDADMARKLNAMDAEIEKPEDIFKPVRFRADHGVVGIFMLRQVKYEEKT